MGDDYIGVMFTIPSSLQSTTSLTYQVLYLLPTL